MALTEIQFIEATRAVATSVLDVFENNGFDRDDAANVAGAALAEIMARQLGPFGAVERLRDIADQCEKQTLGEIGLD